MRLCLMVDLENDVSQSQGFRPTLAISYGYE